MHVHLYVYVYVYMHACILKMYACIHACLYHVYSTTIIASIFLFPSWIWKNGRTEKGGSVPWNAEVTNTDPSNFLWEKNSTAVVTVAPGLYATLFFFFFKRKMNKNFFQKNKEKKKEEKKCLYILFFTIRYEISAAFFTSRSAKVTLFINDIPVLSRESSPATLLVLPFLLPQILLFACVFILYYIILYYIYIY